MKDDKSLGCAQHSYLYIWVLMPSDAPANGRGLGLCGAFDRPQIFPIINQVLVSFIIFLASTYSVLAYMSVLLTGATTLVGRFGCLSAQRAFIILLTLLVDDDVS